MAQHDYVIANGTGAAVRSDLNNALAAIVSQNSGPVAPTTTYAYMPWADTGSSPPVFKIRNAANNGWITLYELDGTFSIEAGSASSPGLYFTGDTNTGIYSPGADQFGISTGGTSRLVIDASGNINMDSGTVYVDAANNRLGIGTTSVSHLLHIKANSDPFIRIEDSTKSAYFGLSAGTGGLDIQYPSIFRIYDVSGSVERARIDSSGRLLVGTTTGYGGIHSYSSTFAPSNSNWTKAALVGSGGYGGGLALIDGSAGYSVRAESSGANFYIQYHSSLTAGGSGGVFLASGAGSWSSVSDEREKVDLSPIENGLTKIQALRAVIGAYKWAPEKKHPFLIAQDVQSVLPEAVSISNPEAEIEDQRLGMSYTDVVPLLVQALQEASSKITGLEARLSALEAQ